MNTKDEPNVFLRDLYMVDWDRCNVPDATADLWAVCDADAHYYAYGRDCDRDTLLLACAQRIKGLAILGLRRKEVPPENWATFGPDLYGAGLFAALEALPDAREADDTIKYMMRKASNAMAREFYHMNRLYTELSHEAAPCPFGSVEFDLVLDEVCTGPNDKQLVDLRIRKYTYPAIAEETGLSEYQARRAVDAIYQRFYRALGLDEKAKARARKNSEKVSSESA